ncbi:MAG TPA: cache domain-containing protein [Gaiellaceae bacterium]
MTELRRPRAPREQDHPYRGRWVHLILGLLVAVLAVTWAGQRAQQGVLANLDTRLQDAGAGADAALITVEAEQLSALRSITFTRGVATAVENSDPTAINRLVTPLQANSNVPMVDVVRPNGQVLFAVRSKGAPRPVASRSGLRAISQSIREARGARGGRFTEVVIFKTGPAFMTVGPLMNGTHAVGVVLVITPLADVLGRISQQVRADLTAYTSDGAPIATTSVQDPPTLDRDTARTLIGGGAIVLRYIHGSDREALGRLIVDHQPDAVLGVSLHDNSPITKHAVMLFAALGLIAAVVILGTFWARIVNREGK